MIKTIFFDIDNTLYSYTQAHAAAFPVVCDYAREQLGLKDFAADWAAHIKSHAAEIGPQSAIHSRLIRCLRILEQHNKPLEYAQVLDRLYWETLIQAAVPEPGVPECLRTLRQRGYVLGIATNMTLDWQLSKLKRLAILDNFRYIISSEEAGAEKPDPRFFQTCLRYAHCQPDECLMVGDSLSGDVLGAEAIGMKALWYAPEDQLSKHPGFHHFSQLEALIEQCD